MIDKHSSSSVHGGSSSGAIFPPRAFERRQASLQRWLWRGESLAAICPARAHSVACCQYGVQYDPKYLE
jgi:hypothetical protein